MENLDYREPHPCDLEIAALESDGMDASQSLTTAKTPMKWPQP